MLDPLGPERRLRSPARLAWLAALEALRAGGSPAPLVALAPAGISCSQLAWLLGVPAAQLPTLGEDVRVLPDGPLDALLVTDTVWHAGCAQVLAALDRFHQTHPDTPGVNAARLRRMALPGLASASSRDTLWRALLTELLRDGQLQASGAWLHLPGHVVALTASEEALADRLLPWIESGGIDPPWVRELAARASVPEEDMRTLLRKLARQGRLFQCVKDLFVAPTRVQSLARLVAELDSRDGHVGVRAADLRDAAGLGRKRAIQWLEFFDRAGYTRRVRDTHVLLGPSGWPLAD